MEFFFDDIRSQTLFSDEEVIRRIAEATANMAQEVLNSEEEDNHKDGKGCEEQHYHSNIIVRDTEKCCNCQRYHASKEGATSQDTTNHNIVIESAHAIIQVNESNIINEAIWWDDPWLQWTHGCYDWSLHDLKMLSPQMIMENCSNEVESFYNLYHQPILSNVLNELLLWLDKFKERLAEEEHTALCILSRFTGCQYFSNTAPSLHTRGSNAMAFHLECMPRFSQYLNLFDSHVDAHEEPGEDNPISYETSQAQISINEMELMKECLLSFQQQEYRLQNKDEDGIISITKRDRDCHQAFNKKSLGSNADSALDLDSKGLLLARHCSALYKRIPTYPLPSLTDYFNIIVEKGTSELNIGRYMSLNLSCKLARLRNDNRWEKDVASNNSILKIGATDSVDGDIRTFNGKEEITSRFGNNKSGSSDDVLKFNQYIKRSGTLNIDGKHRRIATIYERCPQNTDTNTFSGFEQQADTIKRENMPQLFSMQSNEQLSTSTLAALEEDSEDEMDMVSWMTLQQQRLQEFENIKLRFSAVQAALVMHWNLLTARHPIFSDCLVPTRLFQFAEDMMPSLRSSYPLKHAFLSHTITLFKNNLIGARCLINVMAMIQGTSPPYCKNY
eukprot:CAMPEP_0175045784 /NCGR_PEP_ID=MMETSP0052_2-20121109/4644_1 /TAXON_ID=51329 ORGANISM="Polytomella parva, Strain SAG 63-3" /NCGR_SAMPLE_ID=MMETSP0052_2 /ASSEMBLY_ACC=CAM_ASM_000194 /LENGTH=615 /DNA_ID=CAMNT_0016309411 /DNA_START=178 /DNA_END=2025 /DNA_ORIENTATION=+